MLKQLKGIIYNAIRRYRWSVVVKLINKDSTSLLDIGCRDTFTYDKLPPGYNVTLADKFPRNSLIEKADIEKLQYGNRSFDVVLCQEVLEHVTNPVNAISEIKRVARRQIIISVPNEPFFTLIRFFNWDKGHLWAITPAALKSHLGMPVWERKVFFKRYYIASWLFPVKK